MGERAVCVLIVLAAAGGLAYFVGGRADPVSASSVADSLFFRTTRPARSALCDPASVGRWQCDLELEGVSWPVRYVVSVDKRRCWEARAALAGVADRRGVDRELSGCVH